MLGGPGARQSRCLMCTVSSLSLRWDWLYLILRIDLTSLSSLFFLSLSRSQYLPLDSRSLFSLALCRDVQLDVLLLGAQRVLRHGSSPSVRASQLYICVHGGIPIFSIMRAWGHPNILKFIAPVSANCTEICRTRPCYTFTTLVTCNNALGTMPRPGLNPARRGYPV